jgi:hypothetical protein
VDAAIVRGTRGDEVARMHKRWAIVGLVLVACDGGSIEGTDGGVPPGTDGGSAGGGDAGPMIDGGRFEGDGGAGADHMHPFIYLDDANRTRLRDAMSASTAPAARFRQTVDAQLESGNVYGFEPWYAALAYQVTDDARYCEYAVDETDTFVASEEATIATGARASVAGDSYLEVGPIIGSMATVYDYCFAFLDDTQRARWIAYGNQAVFNVWNPDDAEWGGNAHSWNGWSVNNPANNYYYSFLRATMLLGLATQGENDRSAEWLRMFRETKIEAQLVPMFRRDLNGGGSREGTGYGTALGRLFELYDLWQASTGENIADLTTHARLSLPHFLHTIVPTGDFLVPTGDHSRDSTAAFFDYHRLYLLVLAHLYRDTEEAAVARGFLREGPLPEMENRFMVVYDYLYDSPDLGTAPLSTLYPAYYGDGTGNFYFRSGWSADATLLHMIGGPLTESHAHQDQGSILVYRDQWLAYDLNVESHSGIEDVPTMHNLVRLVRDGATLPQRREREPSVPIALHHEAAFSWAAVDVAPVYGDEDVTRVRRDVVFLKPGAIVVFDRIDVAGGITPIWQLASPNMPSITCARVSLPGETDLDVLRVLPASGIDASVVSYSDAAIRAGHRVELRAPGATTFLNVLSIDGAVTSAAAMGTNGVQVVFDGRTYTISFEDGLTIDGEHFDESIQTLPVRAE